MFTVKKEFGAKVETIIGADSVFEGSITSKGSLRVDGRVNGNVSGDSVIIGAEGDVHGDILAKNVIVAGRVDGNITAQHALDLQNHCQVSGDLTTAQLTIAEGAVYEGNCHMAKEKQASNKDRHDEGLTAKPAH